MIHPTRSDHATDARSGRRQHVSADVAPELYAVDAEASE
jgi:hypothetical protein